MSVKESSSKATSAPTSRQQSVAKESAASRHSAEAGNTPKPASNNRTGDRSDTSDVSSEARGPDRDSPGLSDLFSGLRDWATGSAESEKAAQAQDPAPESARPRLELEEGQLLSRGRRSPEQVSQLQEMLNAGGGQLEVDGLFGPRTEEAVRNFQRENGLTVDGIVGPQTLAALNGADPPTGADGRPATGEQSGEVAAQPTGSEPPTERPETAAPNPAEANTTSTGETPQVETPSGEATSTTRLQGIPERAENAVGGREFMESIAHLPPGRERDQAILSEILSGNIPESSRNLQEITVNRGGHEIGMHVMPDYLAIGSDQDNVRVPMTPGVAQAIADRTGTSLPTDRMVDDIHSQAQQLYMPALSNNREGIGTYLHHDGLIDGQIGGETAGGLVSGHKKDIVIPHRDGRVAIYGGRWQNGERIQSYSNVHHSGYEDYSHGARLVSQQITIDGQNMRLDEALADPSLRGLFTNQSGSFEY